jgi:hypothetical protein
MDIITVRDIIALISASCTQKCVPIEHYGAMFYSSKKDIGEDCCGSIFQDEKFTVKDYDQSCAPIIF